MTIARIGIVGAGGRARKHIAAYREIHGATVVAISDLDAERASKVQSEFSVPFSFPTPHELFSSGAVDGVSICTSSDVHARLVEEAAAAGLHILCEKPIAQSLAECDRAIEAAHQRNVILACVFQSRFFPRTQWIRSRLLQGAFGDRVVGRAHGWTIHIWDLLCHLFGDPSHVSAEWLGSHRVDKDPLLTMVRFHSGFAATVEALPVHLLKSPAWPNRLEIIGNRAALSFDLWADNLKICSHETAYAEALRKDLELFRGPQPQIVTGVPEAEDFIAAILNSGKPMVSGMDARCSIELVTAAYKSALSRKSVSLPIEITDSMYPSLGARISD